MSEIRISTSGLPSNSHASKKSPEEKKVKPVRKGRMKVKKSSKLKSMFLKEDAKTIKNSVIFDVIVPAIRDTIYNVIVDSLSMSLFGTPSKSRGGQRGTTISYNSYSKPDSRRERERSMYNVWSMDEIIFERRADAENVLIQLNEIIERFGTVSVADYYDASNYPTDNYMANKYGWTDLSRATIMPVRGGGFGITFPKAFPLD